MTTIDNLSVTTEQAMEYSKRRIGEIADQLEGAEEMACAAAEILYNPAFIEATRQIMETSVGQFFASTLGDQAMRNRAYALNMMHQLYLAELKTMISAPERLAGDMDALREHYQQLEVLLDGRHSREG